MVNELRELMHQATDRPPHETADLDAVLGSGRRRVRIRRAGIVGGTALAAGAIALGSVAWVNPSPPDLAAAGVPRPVGPTIDVSTARPGVAGTDYRDLATYTNEDLNADNGEYFDGVTDDGLVLFREGQTATRPVNRFALMDPATGKKEWLPNFPGGGQQTWAVELSEERLVLLGSGRTNSQASEQVAYVFDRTSSGTWSTLSWPGLPRVDFPGAAEVGPDDRLYVRVPATQGTVPDGGWPMGSDGEADDAGAEGDAYDLWSVSMSDTTDVRNEGLRVGSFAFDGDSLVWTDSTNGAAGRIHVRDLDTGKQTSFDPQSGEKCNLLGFDVAGGRIAMTQYCGTYADGVRDDRVQVLTTDGEQVVTVQDSGLDSGRLIAGGDDLTFTSFDRATQGTYVYDFADQRLLRLSDGISSWQVASGPTPDDQFLWAEASGVSLPGFGRGGATAHLSELLD